MNSGGYAEQSVAKSSLGYIAQPGIRERLEMQKDEYTARLARVQAALDALDTNPAAAIVFEAVMKAL